MKYIPALWFKVLMVGFLLSSSAYAASLEEEAKKTFLDYLTNNKYILVCGDSYYAYMSNGNKDELFIIQGKAFFVELKSEQITYADNLNGLEWNGGGILRAKAMRGYTPQDKWTPWADTEGKE